MILVRNVFRLKFGKAREAVELWKEGRTFMEKQKFGTAPTRLLTDLAGGNFYTLILENTFDSLTDYEQSEARVLKNDEWKKWYQKFVLLVESGHREIYSIVS